MPPSTTNIVPWCFSVSRSWLFALVNVSEWGVLNPGGSAAPICSGAQAVEGVDDGGLRCPSSSSGATLDATHRIRSPA